ncbi:2-keto-4-pentenoate hydratase [Sphingobium boeckii]|uniref:2-keto-4-pentenoate hydratase n=1 Tax=Sphingobium boeckii TaxID=1082345 RepID=A0A7W9AH07_9SPHN|nr:2-keto-4-pentenoate hydratase [Sphingobium boeckii]
MEGSQDQREHERIAEAFVSARRDAQGLPSYPGTIPEALESAYLVQDCAIAMTSDGIGGWKVGRIMPPLDAHYGSNRLAGPIFNASIVSADPQTPVSMPIFRDGFGAAEAELLLRIARDPDPAKLSYTLEEAAAMIDAVHVGIEIASSPFPGINDHGPAVTISDFGNNNGLVIGAPVPSEEVADCEGWPVSLLIDGVVAGTGTAAGLPDGPFGAVRFLLEMMASRGNALQAGQWVSTGAITGVHPVNVGAAVEARFGSSYAVHCTISAAAGANRS